jgi:hypothetical protein
MWKADRLQYISVAPCIGQNLELSKHDQFVTSATIRELFILSIIQQLVEFDIDLH